MDGKQSSLNDAMDEDFLYLVFFIICMYDENRKLSSDRSLLHYIVSIKTFLPALAILAWVASFSLNISRKLHSLFSKTARTVFLLTLYMADTISPPVIACATSNQSLTSDGKASLIESVL